jgi:acyl carrier protein
MTAETDTDRRQGVLDSIYRLLDGILQDEVTIDEDTELVDGLGLSSSMALYLLLELEEELDVHIPVEGFYDTGLRTVGDLADYILDRTDPQP